jgi:uncharacterized protein (TIGR03437 family)
MQGARDTMGNLTKFANPTVANGQVYVPTDSKQVTVYGLLSAPGITAVVNAASFSSFTIAPGELISIFGNSLGPAVAAGAALTPQGNVATSVGGVTATFDGVPAPLLYVSANQVNTIVPYEVAGKSTSVMQLSGPGGATYSAMLPVSATAPAVFVIGGSSGAQGAILNSNLSVNSTANPAARGSTVAIYATGTGLLNQPVTDGMLMPFSSPPLSAAPVTVTIGGLPAPVTYQGAAPGLVAGVMQVNAQVPAAVSSGPAVPVTLRAGGIAGLNTVTMAVK